MRAGLVRRALFEGEVTSYQRAPVRRQVVSPPPSTRPSQRTVNTCCGVLFFALCLLITFGLWGGLLLFFG